jgi:SAM-dependent methyltransferase
VKPSLLDHLACPECHGRLRLAAVCTEGGEVMEGSLVCAGCGAAWPLRGGVPRFVDPRRTPETARTAAAFGWEWRVFARIEPHHERQFLDWIVPAGPDDFRGRVVVEGGCGKGRHTRLAARYGAAAVIGLDLSSAVEVAFANTRDLPSAHVVQADLLRPPLRPGSCDYAFSVGVLHHLPDPSAGFRALAGAVRPGGAVSVWVYGAEGNGFITRAVTPLRIAVTSRLPPRLLHALSFALALPLKAALSALYRPARRPGREWLRRRLFYEPYLGAISGFPLREVHHIVHDHLAAPVAHYLERDAVERWYRDAGAKDVAIAWHNRNSWRGFGRLPAAAAVGAGAATGAGAAAGAGAATGAEAAAEAAGGGRS